MIKKYYKIVNGVLNIRFKFILVKGGIENGK